MWGPMRKAPRALSAPKSAGQGSCMQPFARSNQLFNSPGSTSLPLAARTTTTRALLLPPTLLAVGPARRAPRRLEDSCPMCMEAIVLLALAITRNWAPGCKSYNCGWHSSRRGGAEGWWGGAPGRVREGQGLLRVRGAAASENGEIRRELLCVLPLSGRGRPNDDGKGTAKR